MTVYEKRINYSDLRHMKNKGFTECKQCNISFVFNDICIIRRRHSTREGNAHTFYYHKKCWENLLQ